MSDETQTALDEEEQKRIALDILLEAWDRALAQDVEPEVLATAAIYAALTDMVDLYGEEPVATLVESLPERIRDGEFTLEDEEEDGEDGEDEGEAQSGRPGGNSAA